jgi:alpha-L-arabinofuranosidase
MLEGNTNKTRWDWKKSIGPLKDRPGYPGTWGYQQTNGLGLMEFMYWAEDMNLSPSKSFLLLHSTYQTSNPLDFFRHLLVLAQRY